MQHLDCDRPTVSHVVREINAGHTAMTDLAVDDISAGERVSQDSGNVGHDRARS
jgi:hypothetical protein